MRFVAGYGMTEVGVTNLDLKSNTTLGYSGRLLPTVIAKVEDLTTKKSLPPFRNGEICIKSAAVSSIILKHALHVKQVSIVLLPQTCLQFYSLHLKQQSLIYSLFIIISLYNNNL